MKKIIIFIISFFLTVNYADALELKCPNIASPKEVITCNISTNKYIGIKTNYKLNEGFLYKGLTNTSWKKYYSSNSGFSVGNINNKEQFTTNLNIEISSNIKINQDYKIVLNNIEVVDTNYKTIKLEDITSNIKVVSNDNTLKKLEVTNETLKPKFNSNILEYKVETYNDSINIKATPNDNTAKISGDLGEKKLNYGANIFSIKVTSKRGNTKNYYIYATRKVKKNSNITLKSLKLSNGKIEFDKNKFIYLVDVDYDIEDVTVEAIPENNKSTVKIDKPEKLEIGKNTITITVTAEDGTIGKYSIIITRKDKLSNDATIKSLIIKDYELDFKSDIFEYELEINDEKNLEIDVLLNDDKAKYDIIGNSNLKNNSIITIKVEAQDKTIQEYKIKIIKKENIGEKEITKSNSITEYINLTTTICFIILIIVIIILKIIKDKQKKYIN